MEGERRSEAGKALGLLICGTLVYYHCAYRNSTILSLFSDVLIVLLCSLAILGLLFRQMNISYDLFSFFPILGSFQIIQFFVGFFVFMFFSLAIIIV